MAGRWKQIPRNLVGMPITHSSTQNAYLMKGHGTNRLGVIHQLKRIAICPPPEDRNTWGPKPRPASSVSKQASYPTSSSGPGTPDVTTRSRAVDVAQNLPDGDECNTLSTFDPSSFHRTGLPFQRFCMKHHWHLVSTLPLFFRLPHTNVKKYRCRWLGGSQHDGMGIPPSIEQLCHIKVACSLLTVWSAQR